ncbi:MAG: Trk system potassium transporter TrkA [Planctomycetota bacterium]
MRILLLGGGTVGRWVADILCRRRHSVTLVDSDAEVVRRLNNELDIRAVEGGASRSTVLFQADVCSADMCLAVTGDDEVNIVGASMAKALGARRSIARVYAPALRDLSTFDYQRHFGIDSFLSLEQLSAFELARAIRDPDAIPLEHFARGQLEVHEFEVDKASTSVGHKLRDLDIPKTIRLGSIRRSNHMWLASGEDEIHAEDRISMIGGPEAISDAKTMFVGRSKKTTSRIPVMVAGGGETGYHLADSLSRREYRVHILERDGERCDQLSKLLPDCTVVHANANRRSVLEDEGAGSVDFFVACTGSDESNIMACVEANELGASKVMCVVGRPDYANVVGKLGINHAVSARDVVARQIIGYLNEGAIISRSKLPNGSLVIYELEIQHGSRISQAPLAELPLSGRCLIGAIHRDGFVKVPTAGDQLKPGDVVVALIDEPHAEDVLTLF